MIASQCATGYSLWLIPQGDTGKRLNTLISELSIKYQSPVFAPHITLLGGIANNESKILDISKSLARNIPPFNITLLGVDGEEIYFRCLYINIKTSIMLTRLGTAVRDNFEMQDKPFQPHLSLLYGHLDPIQKANLATELKGQYPVALGISQIEIFHTNGPVQDWQHIASVPLHVQSRWA